MLAIKYGEKTRLLVLLDANGGLKIVKMGTDATSIVTVLRLLLAVIKIEEKIGLNIRKTTKKDN